MLHSSTCNINFTVVVYFLYYISTVHDTVWIWSNWSLCQKCIFACDYFMFFSRMEKSSWEIHERRMKEQYLMAISDKDQQISHLQSLLRELRSSSSQTEALKVQYQRQVSNFSANCYSEVTTTQEALASYNLSTLITIRHDILWLPMRWTGFRN